TVGTGGLPGVGVGELARVGEVAVEAPAAGVAQRVLVLVVPARPRPTGDALVGVGGHDLRREQHRGGRRGSHPEDPVLGLDPHDPAHSHTLEPSRGRAPPPTRYWPTQSWENSRTSSNGISMSALGQV